MVMQVYSGALVGVEAVPVGVEVDLLRRLPGVCIVGLPAGAVRESAERVRSAVVAEGLEFPRKRVVINLAPADLRKDGAAFDLPIAVGILAADGAISQHALDQVMLVGELSLSGELRPVRGALSLALAARRLGRQLIVPLADANRAAVVPDLQVFGAKTLGEVVRHLTGEAPLPLVAPTRHGPPPSAVDMKEVRGQELGRRALEIAAAGGHHVFLEGPPGCGKSMLARRFSTILPELSFEEALEVTQIYGAAGLLEEGTGVLSERPFRSPHHSVTMAGLVGDRTLRPGELSLAHRGVLFLDEAPEFRRTVLEVLRAPLEEGKVVLSRAQGTVQLPAEVTLVMAANPCPCGMRGSDRACWCTDREVRTYRKRISGPILDRVDLYVPMEAVGAEELFATTTSESSACIRERVEEARKIQLDRDQGALNGRLQRSTLDRVVSLSPRAKSSLLQSVRTLKLSGRAATRLLKVSRTIADLEQSPSVHSHHFSEALGFRLVGERP